MHERGTVVAVDDGSALISMESSADCEVCGACAKGAAGARLLEGVVDEHGVRPGDLVEVETPAAARRRAQGLAYVVPVMAALSGYVAGFLLGSWIGINTDVSGAVAAIGAGAVALASLKRFDRFFGRGEVQPRVRAIIARVNGDYPG